MNASSTRSAQPVTRLACNRCHQQKLRCHRSLVPGQPCARCENAQVECIFEPPLRPGRPSTRRKSRSKPPSPSKSDTVSSSVKSPQQQDDQLANDPPRGYLSELDGLFDVVASECPMGSSNDGQVSLSPFPDPSPDEPLLSSGCKSPLNSGYLYMAPDWLHLPMQPHSSAPKTPSSSLAHGETFQPTAAITTFTLSSSSSSSSSSSTSTSSLLVASDVNFYRLSELSMTLNEFSCQLAAATATATAGAQSESVVDPPPTITIDQILAVTQSLADILSPVPTHNDPNNNNLQLPKPPCPRADFDYPFHVASRSSPDGATSLLILSCYLRLLHLYNTALSSPSAVAIAPVSPAGTGNGNVMQPLRFQIGCFSTPMTSSMALLACVSSQLLGNLEAALRRLALSMPAVGRGEQSWPWEPDAGPGSCVMIIARAAMLEARTLQANLRQRLHFLNSVSSPE
ncbi:hypothetical protein CNMCM5623_008722 [Aspergillus felis]|uniref:Zn(2)-C6 fungal-type domain-containing protein n=1 Tax=Aspergillus felis TaxID=1287682 RepID=A0A8H6PK92_9EURO|nr:hypothetical protein CNMCM5623_008722 [Aspergillus felis]KAF7179993.1 hypothetical protein CNMCM7691_009046 [Aspergillus felis]